MNGISVHLNYPSLSQKLPSPAPPVTRRQSSALSNRITYPQGIVDCYDVTELSDQLRYFGISDETRRAITNKKKSATPTQAKRRPTTPSVLNHSTQFKSRDHTNYPVLRSAASRSCYVNFTGSFKDDVRAKSLPLATRYSAPNPQRRTGPLPRKSLVVTRSRKRPTRTTKETVAPKPAQIKNGLLVIANGQIVDLKKDVKQSEKLSDKERKRLRNEMREHLDIVCSFDKLMEEFDNTKLEIDKLKFK